jgi:predicted kinase
MSGCATLVGMATLIVTRAIPGAGKTTWAKDWVDEDPEHRARVNRDDLRAMLHNSIWSQDKEFQVQAVRDAIIRRLLERGVDVVSDDTSLPSRTVRDLRKLAVLSKAEFKVKDMTDVPLELCLERNRNRLDKAPVPEDWIITQYRKFILGRPYPLPIADEPEPDEEEAGWVPYDSDESLPRAILVDLDGTVALKGDRSPYDESRVHEDRPNEPVVAVVRAMIATGHRIVFCSGRTEACRIMTEKWLAEHVVATFDGLHMRSVGDFRGDSVVKLELFDQHIRYRYCVVAVLDDRTSVVKAWRAIGLTVLQVAESNF